MLPRKNAGGVLLAVLLALQAAPVGTAWATASMPEAIATETRAVEAQKDSNTQNDTENLEETNDKIGKVATEKTELQQFEVNAPNSDIRGVVTFDAEKGIATYTVYNGEETIVEQSALGLVTNQGDFSSGLVLTGDPATTSGTDSYSLIGGKKSKVEAKYNQTTLTFTKEEAKATFGIVLRAYDDGVALRYTLDGSTGELQITDEATTLTLPNKYQKIWYQSCGDNSSVSNEWTFYEWNSAWWGQPNGKYNMPMLYQTASGSYALYSEAEILTGTYCGSILTGTGSSTLSVDFAPEQAAEGAVKVDSASNFASPWRYVVTGDLATIANNTMAENVSAPSAISDTS